MHLEATVSDDLRQIDGILRFDPADGLVFRDLLSGLPIPTDDQLRRATFPFRAEPGALRIEAEGPGQVRFTAHLPRRYGAAGLVPGRGLFVNGLWHPQPTRDGAPVQAQWQTSLHLPAGVAAALNNVAEVNPDDRTLRYAGEAAHLGLAVVPGGRVDRLEGALTPLRVLRRGPSPRRRDARLLAAADEVAGLHPRPAGLSDLLVIQSPDRRRIARSSAQTVFLSDRAFRVSLGLWSYHTAPVRRALLSASADGAEPWAAGVGAALLDGVEGQPPADLKEQLRWAAWIPEVDQLLYDGRLPFYADIMGEAWPGDKVKDDPAERLAPTTPPVAVAQRARALLGDAASAQLGRALLQGEAPAEAARAVGLDPALLLAWRPDPPPSALSLRVRPQPSAEAPQAVAMELRRAGPPDLPPTPITLWFSGPEGPDERRWDAPAGPGEVTFLLPAAPEVAQLDRAGLERQDDRSDDRWPRRWTTIASFFPTELALSAGRISGAADLAFRRQYDTHNLYLGSISTDPMNLLSADLGYIRAMGPLQDHRNRPLRWSVGGGPSLLDPGFRSTAGGQVALGAWTGLSHETRTDTLFPRSGHRLSMGLSGGLVPGGARWGTVAAGGVAVVGLGGRAALASRLSGALTEGEVAHRLLPLGGGDGLSALAARDVLGRRRALAAVELRGQALRFVSVPGPLVWLSDVQLSAGLEAGALSGAEEGCGAPGACTWTGLGWTGGIALTGDVFGVRPTLLGLWLAAPLWLELGGPAAGPPPAGAQQTYVRLTQPF